MVNLSDERIELQIGLLYSYLGHRCIHMGDVAAMKFLYGNICFEQPPLIETISRMQYCITPEVIYYDTEGKYSSEFLYYWGMTCVGELSSLIIKDFDIATTCFNKILVDIPKAESRIAYIKLLQSDEPYKYESNTRNIGVLTKWAGKTEIFSMITLAKISHYDFLIKDPDNDAITSTIASQLLDYSCGAGHPVAIKFYDSIIEDARRANKNNDSRNVYARPIFDNRVDIDILYDC